MIRVSLPMLTFVVIIAVSFAIGCVVGPIARKIKK